MNAPAARSDRTMPILGIIAGGVAAFVALALLAGGTVLLWAAESKTDADGYYASAKHRYQTASNAIVTENVDVGGDAPSWLFGSQHFGRLRIRATGAAGKPIFVGVGPTRAIESYLAGVRHDEIADLSFDPFSVDYRRLGGERRPAPPARQSFWVAALTGKGEQTLDWGVSGGDWSVVVMNADGSPRVSADADAAVKVPFVRRLGTALWVPGLILGLAGAAGIVLGTRSLINGRRAAVA